MKLDKITQIGDALQDLSEKGCVFEKKVQLFSNAPLRLSKKFLLVSFDEFGELLALDIWYEIHFC